MFALPLRVLRTIIPEPQHRTPLTLQSLPFILSSYLPFVYLAYLSRRTDTHLLRLCLLPVVLITILSTAFGYFWTIPSLNVYNWGQCLLAEVLVAKSFEFALPSRGFLKVGEKQPGEPETSANGAARPIAASQRPFLSFCKGVRDAFEAIFTLRGQGWHSGHGTNIPREFRSTERVPFLRETFLMFLKDFLLLDFLESSIKIFPGVGTPEGGTMFYPHLPPLQRFTISTIIHIFTGSALLAGFGLVYNLLTLIAVGIFKDETTSWPPFMDNPWRAHSLHDFWATHWHQFLKQTFIVLGGYPGKWIAGNLGMLFGVFLASGLFHECAMTAMGNGMDHTVTIFFTSQALLLILERLWRRVTGRRVSGWPGRLWVYSVLFIGAQPMVDAWHKRGLGGGMVIPPFLSPFKFLLPLIYDTLAGEQTRNQ